MKTWLDLTDRFPIRFDVARMKADLDNFQNSAAWLKHYDHALSQGWRAILLKSTNGDVSGPMSQYPSWDFSDYRRTPYVNHLPYFRDIMDGLKCPQGRMRIMRLNPGMVINLHRDSGAEVGCLAFGQVRLHVPIVTNDRVTFFVGGERIRMQVGRVYYVNFSKRHYVRNDGREPRTHLVMDLKVNDWLAQCFPNPSSWEQVEFAAARATWPTLWRLRKLRLRAERQFWKHYEGSRTQAVMHRLRGKDKAAA
jgi:hypothetical protein